jgi:hypothetical protein
MDEPSVLDFVKAKLRFWKKSDLHIPAPVAGADQAQTVPGADQTAEVIEQSVSAPSTVKTRLPWLVLLSLFLCLVGQMVIEPPGRNAPVAIAMYLVGGLCLGVAAWYGMIRLGEAQAEPVTRQKEDLTTAWVAGVLGLALGLALLFVAGKVEEQSLLFNGLRLLFAGLSLVLGLGITVWGLQAVRPAEQTGGFWTRRIGRNSIGLVVALILLILLTFLTFGDGLFTDVNLFLWLVTLFVAVLATARFDPRVWLAGVRTRWFAPFVFRFDIFLILLLAVIGLTAYFRLNDLNGIPREMFSDHAEKLYDVNDVLHGQFKVFFERNTGREMFQFYWTAFMALVFNSGISYMSLKIGTVIAGLVTLVFIYRLGNEMGGKWVALYALFFAAIAYWPNIISRIGLRFPFYPFCVAPVLFYLLRGLRREVRADFIWAGLWLGIGLHGYTASRVVPLLILAAFGLYLLHKQSQGKRFEALVWLGVLALIAFVVLLPLFRYALDHPEMVNYRTLTRMGTTEQALPGPAGEIFLKNLWNGLTMFFWDNGNVWVHSIPNRPALVVVDAALFFSGLVLLLARYIRRRHWRDLFIPLSLPILLLPSILSLAFPNENPNLNRTAGAYVVVFVIAALAFDAFLRAVWEKVDGKRGLAYAAALAFILGGLSLTANHNLFFGRYAVDFNNSAWNTSEMGAVMRGFSQIVGTPKTTWVVGYPHWVDTRLVGITAGYPEVNPETFADRLEMTFEDPNAKMYLVNPADTLALDKLRVQFPAGRFWLHKSPAPGKDFIVFMVPAELDMMP